MNLVRSKEFRRCIKVLKSLERKLKLLSKTFHKFDSFILCKSLYLNLCGHPIPKMRGSLNCSIHSKNRDLFILILISTKMNGYSMTQKLADERHIRWHPEKLRGRKEYFLSNLQKKFQ